LIQKKQKIKAVKPELKKARFAKMFETHLHQTFLRTASLFFLTFTFHYADLCGEVGGSMIANNHITFHKIIVVYIRI